MSLSYNLPIRPNGLTVAEMLALTPVAKYTLAGTDFVWLITSVNAENPKLGYGMTQMHGHILLGEINLETVETIRGPNTSSTYQGILFTKEELLSPPACKSVTFSGKYPLSVYHNVAKELGYIETREEIAPDVWTKHRNALLP